MYMGINLNAVQKILAFHFSQKVENGRGVMSNISKVFIYLIGVSKIQESSLTFKKELLK